MIQLLHNIVEQHKLVVIHIQKQMFPRFVHIQSCESLNTMQFVHSVMLVEHVNGAIFKLLL